MNRFRVRGDGQPWTLNGPDLLRTRENATKRVRALVGEPDKLKEPEVNGEAVRGKGEVMDRFEEWRPKSKGDIFRVTEIRRGERAVSAIVRFEPVPIIDLRNCSPKTIENHSLLEYQFPGVVHSGGYLFRQISGSSEWSDHAWGTATDDSQSATTPNDRVTDWCARMARAGLMDFDHLYGSRDGKVVRVVAPDFDIEPSSAAASHLWHVHISYTDHDGRKPPQTVMFP